MKLQRTSLCRSVPLQAQDKQQCYCHRLHTVERERLTKQTLILIGNLSHADIIIVMHIVSECFKDITFKTEHFEESVIRNTVLNRKEVWWVTVQCSSCFSCCNLKTSKKLCFPCVTELNTPSLHQSLIIVILQITKHNVTNTFFWWCWVYFTCHMTHIHRFKGHNALHMFVCRFNWLTNVILLLWYVVFIYFICMTSIDSTIQRHFGSIIRRSLYYM